MESGKLPCGYDDVFLSAFDEDFQCRICDLPLREPVLTRCGHRLCRLCLEQYMSRKAGQHELCPCPVYGEELDRNKDIFPDKATERKILSFTIKCSSEGCEWTGELREKEDHLSSCNFKLVNCTNEKCQVITQRKQLEEHVTITCQWRTIICDHCYEPHPKCLIQDHVDSNCKKKPVECPNSCGNIIVREEIMSHTNKDCPLSMVSCPYVQMGCNSKIQRKKVQSHLQSKMPHHLDLTCKTFKETIGKLEEEVKALQLERLTLKTQVKELTDEKVALDAKMAAQEKETSELKSESSGFVWKISGFTEVLQQAMKDGNKKIYSSPFSTGRHGYKVIVGMRPSGDRTLKNRYLSVFLGVMNGDYDAILAWPFHRKVTFTLIDQQDDPTKRQNVVCSLLTSTGDSCCARPRPTTGITELPGIARFVSHKNLKTNRYIVDDTLFLQIEIDLPQ